MSSRRQLLEELFRRLEDHRLSWCVLRNYAELFIDSPSDVDLLTTPAQAAKVIAVCGEAAGVTGFTLIQHARFVNHSLVFWNGADCFVRIDIDTEIRWKRFHVLAANSILESRRKYEGFYVPAAPHEAAILLTQALWQGKLSERYAQQLKQLALQLTDPKSLTAWFDQAFGCGKSPRAALDDPNLLKQLAQAVSRSVFWRPTKAVQFLGYGLKDVARLMTRHKNPPGLFIRMIGVNPKFTQELVAGLGILFPVKKGAVTSVNMSRAERKRILFKGGLAIEMLPPGPKSASLLRRDWPELNHSFAVVGEAGGAAQFIHIGSGQISSGIDATALVQFIGASLAQLHRPKKTQPRGAFAVLVGLDGAGKTTLARNIATLACNESAIAGVRYFHWLPPLQRTLEFPLPEPGNQPRKAALDRNAIQATLSVLRLGKNLLRAQLAWWWRLRSWRQRGYLVLVDRYFYNYYLDPVSVKYYGPRWVLNMLTKRFPKPEIVITLSAPPEILLQRKQELTEAEMRAQAATLQELKFPTGQVIAADASEPAAVVAQKTMSALRKMLS